ncbi:hypothetical protein BDY21DRAFT_190473 [Lineolata rhizophorae]|uniref:Uncharacterized protein n=1 Tax=Lineolata rhizophorae TaxID=578093 RepID=A0A6A6P6C9_9PEZI|nr:hypothetical protein BDY21DRAFT_190473 [Lineolata rhizophorae]
MELACRKGGAGTVATMAGTAEPGPRESFKRPRAPSARCASSSAAPQPARPTFAKLFENGSLLTSSGRWLRSPLSRTEDAFPGNRSLRPRETSITVRARAGSRLAGGSQPQLTLGPHQPGRRGSSPLIPSQKSRQPCCAGWPSTDYSGPFPPQHAMSLTKSRGRGCAAAAACCQIPLDCPPPGPQQPLGPYSDHSRAGSQASTSDRSISDSTAAPRAEQFLEPVPSQPYRQAAPANRERLQLLPRVPIAACPAFPPCS